MKRHGTRRQRNQVLDQMVALVKTFDCGKLLSQREHPRLYPVEAVEWKIALVLLLVGTISVSCLVLRLGYVCCNQEVNTAAKWLEMADRINRQKIQGVSSSKGIRYAIIGRVCNGRTPCAEIEYGGTWS